MKYDMMVWSGTFRTLIEQGRSCQEELRILLTKDKQILLNDKHIIFDSIYYLIHNTTAYRWLHIKMFIDILELDAEVVGGSVLKLILVDGTIELSKTLILKNGIRPATFETLVSSMTTPDFLWQFVFGKYPDLYPKTNRMSMLVAARKGEKKYLIKYLLLKGYVPEEVINQTFQVLKQLDIALYTKTYKKYVNGSGT